VLHKGGRNTRLQKAAASLLTKHDDTPEARVAYDAVRYEPELPQGERNGVYSRAQAHHARRKASGEHAVLFEQAESVFCTGQNHINLSRIYSVFVKSSGKIYRQRRQHICTAL
jgi:hypothetical protein